MNGKPTLYAFWNSMPELGPDPSKGYWVSHKGRIITSTDPERMLRFAGSLPWEVREFPGTVDAAEAIGRAFK